MDYDVVEYLEDVGKKILHYDKNDLIRNEDLFDVNEEGISSKDYLYMDEDGNEII